MHLLEHIGQRLHLFRTVMGIDHATRRKVQRLDGIGSRANDGPGDGRVLEDDGARVRRRNGQQIVLRHTHTDQRAVEAQEPERLGIRGVGGRTHDDGVGAQPVGERLDMLGDRLALVVGGELGDVDEMLRPGLLDQLGLAAVVDADYAQPHPSTGQLHRDVAQSAAGAGDHHPLARPCVAALERGVHGGSCAEHRSGRARVQAVRDRRDIVGWAQGVLLEGAGGVVSRHLLGEAEPVGSRSAGDYSSMLDPRVLINGEGG